MNLKEVRDIARGRTAGCCRACRICDGKACAGEIPGMGGAGTGSSFRANLEALARLRFRTRLVHGASRPELATEVLGIKLAMPVMIAPVGGLSFNLGGAMEEAAYQRAIASGAGLSGISCGTPDAAAPGVFETGLAEARAAPGRGFLPFVKPWEEEEAVDRMRLAKASGCRAVAMDLDSVGLATLRLMKRPCLPKTPEELSALVSAAHSLGLKFALKGVMCPRDAGLAVEAGCDAVIVSNHGGRVLDSVPGTAEALPSIAAAVRGRAAVLCDGGVRSGGDVLKMLALGAGCVMIGRPFTVAAVGGGAEGVALLASEIRQELENAMVMTGTASVADVSADILV
jgi:isopentenyl diphosphate isomerase/L-lactate dehydrogenase-like FMN-dependent dehydrogenase